MKKKKTVQIYRDEKKYWGQAFFEGNECITFIHGNDGEWRDQHDVLLLHFGIEIEHVEKINKKQKASLKTLMCD